MAACHVHTQCTEYSQLHVHVHGQVAVESNQQE